MRKTMKKSIAIVLTILMALSLFVTPAFAAGVKKAEQPGDVSVQDVHASYSVTYVDKNGNPTSPSSEYQGSQYYTNLCNVDLNGDQRHDIIEIARSQKGYIQGSLNGSGGSDKTTEYNQWFFGSPSHDWCAAFVSWCARQAGVPISVIGNSGVARPHCAPGYPDAVHDDRFNIGRIHYVADGYYAPKPGDLVFYEYGHVGIVSNVHTNTSGIVTGFDSVEGNTSGGKCKEHINKSMSSSQVYAFGEPYYTSSNIPTPAPTPEPTPEPTPVPKYAVTFIDGFNGATIDVQQVTEGGAAVAPPPPTHTGYHFTGWDKDFNNITAPLTVTAQYAINTYTVEWQNWNGDALETDYDVPYNTIPEYNGETPEREATAQYTYTFSGWEPEIVPVTDNAVYTAQYDAALNKYTVTFYDYDNAVLQQGEVYYGETPVPPADPNNYYGYHFVCWSPELAPVTGDAEYYAQYAINEYDIIFNEYIYDSYDEYYGEGGYWDVFDTQTVEHGSTPYDPGEPDNYYGHHFVGWKPEVEPIEGDYDGQEFVFDAQYEINTYYVHFVDPLTYEELCDVQEVDHGNCVDVPDYLEHEGYVFNCWTRDYSDMPVDPAAPVKGNYHEQHIYFYARYDVEITFCDWNGVPFYTQYIPWTDDYWDEETYIEPPEAAPEHNGYTFTGWSPEFENPHYYYEGPKTYIAQYKFNHPEDPDIIFKTNTVYTEKPYEDVTIDFTVEALRPYECHAFTGFIYYEPSELTLIGDELIKGEIWQQIEELGGMVAVDTSVPGKIGLTVIMPNAGFDMSGTIFSMNFHVENYHDWQGYTSPLFIEIAKCVNYPEGGEETPIVYDIENGSVNIYDMTFGDVNWDGKIDTTDVVLIMRHTLGVQTLTGKYFAAADFNHDGIVNAADALLIMRSIMNLG